jgi:hypothetical protein
MAFTIPVCPSTTAASLYVLGVSLNFQWKIFTFSNGILTPHFPRYLAIDNAVLLDQRRLSAASEKSYSLARL